MPALLLHFACGRVDFEMLPHADGNVDGTSCTPANHDEDGDLVDDACDVCPHLVDAAQADRDGDGVGDSCDIEPDNPRQRIVLFDPFVTLDPIWIDRRGAAVSNDELVLSPAPSSAWLYKAYTPGNDLFITSATADAFTGGQHLFALDLFQTSNSASYYCELVDTGTTMSLKLTQSNGAGMYTNAGSAVMTSRLANGSGTASYRIDATGVECNATWGSDTKQAQGPLPAVTAADKAGPFSSFITMRFAYYLHIRSQ